MAQLLVPLRMRTPEHFMRACLMSVLLCQLSCLEKLPPLTAQSKRRLAWAPQTALCLMQQPLTMVKLTLVSGSDFG